MTILPTIIWRIRKIFILLHVMKKIYTILLVIALFTLSGVMSSCDEKTPTNDPTEEPKDPEDDPNNKGDEPDLGGPEPIEHPDVPTPFEWSVDKATPKVATDGVTIEVLAKENKNIQFACRPGQRVKSFRLDVYPLSILYNALLEKMNSEGMSLDTPANKVQVEGWIREFMFAEGGSAAYTFCESEELNYNNMIFDWANTEYMQAEIVPDCEYVIVAIGCSDESGLADTQLDMTICYVRTPSMELKGAPAVGIDVTTWTDRFKVDFTPNDDCHYFYYMWSMEADLMPYINHYGEQLFRDYMRSHVIGGLVSREDLDYHSMSISGFPAGADTTFMVTAIGTDLYETPAKEFTSAKFRLKEVPDSAMPADAEITIDTDHVGSNLAWFEADMAASTRVVFYRVYTKEEADAIRNGTEQQQAEVVADLAYQGYGMVNENYRFDMETEDLSKSKSYKGRSIYMGLEPNTEFVIAYTAVNPYQLYMPLKFSEPFKTDALVTNTPEACESNLNLSLVATSYTNVRFDFVFDFEKTAVYYFRWVNPDSDDPAEGGLSESATREEMLDFMLGMDANLGAPLSMVWEASPSGVDTYTMVLEQGTTYKVAYVAEDWNGVLGDVKFVSVTTPTLVGGMNPEGKISLVQETDSAGNVVKEYFKFEIVKECAQFKYLVGYEEGEAMMRYLGMDPYKEIWKTWNWYCTDCGLTAKGHLSTTLDINRNQLVEGRCVALMIPIGTDVLGAEVYGDLQHLIYENGESRTLDSYYPTTTAARVAELPRVESTMAKASAEKAAEIEELRPAKGQRVKMWESANEATENLPVMIRVDRRADGAHPKAYLGR